MQVSSSYKRATLSVTVATSATNATWAGPRLTFAKSAYKPGMAPPGYPAAAWSTAVVCPGGIAGTGGTSCVDALGVGAGGLANTSTLSAAPAAPSLVAGFDMSCQQSDLAISLPPAGVVGGNSLAASNAAPLALVLAAPGGYGAIQADWSGVAAAARPRVRYSSVTTSAGPVALTGYQVGAKGLAVSTSEGAITLTGVDAVCDPADVGGAVGGVRATAAVGSVVVAGLTSLDCDVVLSSQQAAVSLSGGPIGNSLGGGMAYLQNSLGVTTFSNVVAQARGKGGRPHWDAPRLVLPLPHCRAYPCRRAAAPCGRPTRAS